MIVVTRLNGSRFAVNPDLVERIHASPDTTLVMVDGGTYIVAESMAEVIERVAAYRAHVIALARTAPADARPAPALGLVDAIPAADAASTQVPAVPLRGRTS